MRWIALTLVLAAAPAWSAEPVKKVLFIGVDGCRLDALQAANTPHLDRLIAEGTLAIGTEIIAPRETPGDTVSGPGWSNLLCGVWPDKHGVVDNSFKGSNYPQFPHFFARLKAVRPQCVTASFSDWGPLKDRIVSQADIAVGEDARGAAAYVEADARIARRCATTLREKPVDAAMLYLGQVDETGHVNGFHPQVPEYIAAIERVDGLIGEVLDGVRARPTFAQEEWLVLVATDHGGVGTGHGGGRQIDEIRRTFLIVSGPATERGQIETPTYQVDVVATALAHLGITPNPEWMLDGKPVAIKGFSGAKALPQNR